MLCGQPYLSSAHFHRILTPQIWRAKLEVQMPQVYVGDKTWTGCNPKDSRNCRDETCAYHVQSLWPPTTSLQGGSSCIGMGRPMAPKESDFYGYIKHLQEEKRGPTSGTAFLKSVGFFEGCFKYLVTPAAVFLSTRSLGAAWVMSSTKRSLRQAPPLTTDHVYLLAHCCFTNGYSKFYLRF